MTVVCFIVKKFLQVLFIHLQMNENNFGRNIINFLMIKSEMISTVQMFNSADTGHLMLLAIRKNSRRLCGPTLSLTFLVLSHLYIFNAWPKQLF